MLVNTINVKILTRKGFQKTMRYTSSFFLSSWERKGQTLTERELSLLRQEREAEHGRIKAQGTQANGVSRI